MINKLKKNGIKFDKGLTSREFISIERIYGFEFPGDIKRFFAVGLPISQGFYNWRDLSEENIQKIKGIQDKIVKNYILSFKRDCVLENYAQIFPNNKQEIELKKALCDFLLRSPKLIPIFNKDFCFADINDMPILTYKNPTQISLTGINLEEWLKKKFLHINSADKNQYKFLEQKLNNSGIWKYLIK